MKLALLCGLGACLVTALVALQQSAPGGGLPAALKQHVQNDRFQIITSVRGLPLGVRERMQQLFGSTTLDIADPGADFRRNDAPGSALLPLRRLVAAGCAADNHCLVYYERGGASLTRRVMLFHWSPSATTFEWGATAPAGFDTIEAVRVAVVAGKITAGPAGPW